MSLSVAASRRNSSRLRGRRSRRSRPEAVIAVASRRICSTGRSAQPATIQADRQATAIAAGPPISSVSVSLCSASLRSVIVAPTTTTSPGEAVPSGTTTLISSTGVTSTIVDGKYVTVRTNPITGAEEVIGLAAGHAGIVGDT